MARALKFPNAVLPGRAFQMEGKTITMIRRDRSGSGLFRNEATGAEDWLRIVAVESWIDDGRMKPLGKIKKDDSYTQIEPNHSASPADNRLDAAEGRSDDGFERRPAGDRPGRVPNEDQLFQSSGLDRQRNPAAKGSGRTEHASIATMETEQNKPESAPEGVIVNKGETVTGSAEQAQTVTLEDGRVIDLETGEVIDVVVPAELLTDNQAKMNDGLAEWVLQKMMRHDSRVLSATRKWNQAAEKAQALIDEAMKTLEDSPEMIELRAIQKNAQKIIKDSGQAADFFHMRYDRDLGNWALMQLGTSKERTWTTEYGQISLTAVPAKVIITKPELALKWAEKNAPKAIKHELLISGVPKEQKAEWIKDPKKAVLEGFDVEPATEKVKVTTNAGIATKQETKKGKA